MENLGAKRGGTKRERPPVKVPKRETKEVALPEIDDYADAPYFPLLRKIPQALVAKHLRQIEKDGMDDATAESYLRAVLERRSEAMTTTVVSEPALQGIFERMPGLLKQIETTVFNNPEMYLGKGQTARVQRLDLVLPDTSLSLAIKYVTSPTEKTLTAAGEHDVIKEAELLTTIEIGEEQHRVNKNLIRVPHPYFHHTTDKLQCYGMEHINGKTLKQIFEGEADDAFLDILRKSPVNTLPIEELDIEITKFWNAVHDYCLHGDVKPGNMMVDKTTGTFYIIDFGQAVPNLSVPAGGEEQVENLRDDEIKITHQAIMQLRRRLAEAAIAAR